MELDNILQNLTELHVHLGSSSTPHFLWELAHEQGIRLPEKNYWKFIEYVTMARRISFEKYLRRIDIPEKDQAPHWALSHKIQSSPYAVERCVHQAISSSYRNAGVTTIEVRFNPMFRNRMGEHDLDKIILAAIYGMKKACLEYPVKAGLIFETDRQLSKQQHITIAQKAVNYKNMGVVGIDISGPNPDGFVIEDWIDAAQIAHEGGIGITLHTGEQTGVREMWSAVNKIKPHRIGHGIAAVKAHDAKLLKLLCDEQIVLEICPTSNVLTSIVKDWAEMKTIIRTLIEYKILFTINSDNPVLLDTNVKKEFTTLLEKNILSCEEVKRIISLARTASFIK